MGAAWGLGVARDRQDGWSECLEAAGVRCFENLSTKRDRVDILSLRRPVNTDHDDYDEICRDIADFVMCLGVVTPDRETGREIRLAFDRTPASMATTVPRFHRPMVA